MTMSVSRSRLRFVAAGLLAAACSSAHLSITEDGPVIELDSARPSASFDVQLCTKERGRGFTGASGRVIVDGLQASSDDSGARVRVFVHDAGEDDQSEVIGDTADDTWTGFVTLDESGPWDDNQRGCGPVQRVTFELLDAEEADAAEVHWRVEMGMEWWKNLEGKNRGWEERDLEIVISPG
jgi:hypothetical protein